MKLMILNKNKIDPTGTYDIGNIQSYKIDTGFVITENYNETLDSANIRLSNLANKIDIEPFDEVMLYDDVRFQTKYMCIDSYTQTQNSLGNEITYNYEISLFSQTKLLENIILPNLSITPRRITGRLNIIDYMAQIIDEYGEKIRINDGTHAPSYVKRYDIESSQTFIDKFSVECPEMQWNAPTLREVLTDLMCGDCIPILNNGVISFIDLTKVNNEITNYNYIQNSQSSNDYVSELKMTMQNVLQTSLTNVRNTIKQSLFIPFNSDSYAMTTDNILIKTDYPILNVKSLNINFIYSLTGTTRNITKDFCNIDGYSLVKEYKEYQTLEVLKDTTEIEGQTGDILSKYQNSCVYFQRGSNVITGFTNLTKLIPLFTASRATWEMWRAKADQQAMYTKNFYILVQVEYETTANQVFSAGKSEEQTTYRQVVDNQTNSWVDAYNQGNLEYQKANRLGNKQIMINQRIENNSQQFARIGDKLEDNIIYQTQYQVYDDYIGVNAYATKDYILRDYYTGVNSKIRTWVNATDEAFKKDNLYKLYCEFSYNQHNDYFTLNNDLSYYCISQLVNNSVQYITCGAIKTNTAISSEIKPSQSDFYLVNTINRVMGNSVVISCGFSDNAIAGKYVNISDMTEKTTTIGQDIYRYLEFKTSDLLDSNGVPLNVYSYTDADFEYLGTNIKLCKGVNFNDDVINGSSWDVDATKPYFINRYHLPKCPDTTISQTMSNPNGVVFEYNNVNEFKDNKEIPAYSFQFEFCSDTRDIYFTKYFLQSENAVRTITMPTIDMYISNTCKYGSETLPSDATILQQVGLSLDPINNKVCGIKLTSANPIGANRYVYLVANNKVLLCFKTKSTTNIQEIYLNILKNRNKNYYYKDNAGRLIKGGTI